MAIPAHAAAVGRWTARARWRAALAAAVLLAAAAWPARTALFGDTAFLLPPLTGPGEWIIYPEPGHTGSHPDARLDTRFGRSFTLTQTPGKARLRFRAFRSCTIQVNGQSVWSGAVAGGWKHSSSLEVGPVLRAGRNRIEVVAANDLGPPALWLALDWPGGSLGSDSSWETSWAGAATLPAAVASDPVAGRYFDPDHLAEPMGAAIQAAWPRLLLFLGLALAASLVLQLAVGRRADDPAALARTWRRINGGALAAAMALWIALFAHNLPWLGRATGFDAQFHLDYIQFVQTHHDVPMAYDGFEMYQPPLYYLINAAVLTAAGSSVQSSGGVAMIRGLNLMLGLADLALLMACARLLFPQHPRRQLLAFLVGAVLPMHIYIFHYTTNEVLVTTAGAAAAWLTLRSLGRGEPRWGDHVGLGLVLGAAMLAKVSGLILLPAVAGVLGVRVWLGRKRLGPARGFAMIAAMILLALAVCGWYYGRVWAHFGKPFIANWDQATGWAGWQEAGYHTLLHYFRIGRCLTSPLFSGYDGVGDAFYSTLWGDGLCGGNTVVMQPPWAYDLVVAGFMLALLPTLALAVGVAAAAAGLIFRPTLAWLFVMGLAFTAGFAMVYMTIICPSYSQPKSFYGLVALVPFCTVAGLGLDLLAGRRAWRRVLVLALAGTWAINSFASHWANPSDPRVRVGLGYSLRYDGDIDGARDQFRAALAMAPDSTLARDGMLNTLALKPSNVGRLEALAELPAGQPDRAFRHVILAACREMEGRSNEVPAELEQAARLAPDDSRPFRGLAAYYADRHEYDKAIAAAREMLRIDPFDIVTHRQLAGFYLATGQEGTTRHLAYLREVSGKIHGRAPD